MSQMIQRMKRKRPGKLKEFLDNQRKLKRNNRKRQKKHWKMRKLTADPSKPKDPLSIIRSRFPDLTDDQLKKKLKNKRKNERRKEKKKN